MYNCASYYNHSIYTSGSGNYTLTITSPLYDGFTLIWDAELGRFQQPTVLDLGTYGN